MNYKQLPRRGEALTAKLTVWLTEAQKAEIMALADQAQRSVNGYIGKIVTEHLASFSSDRT